MSKITNVRRFALDWEFLSQLTKLLTSLKMNGENVGFNKQQLDVRNESMMHTSSDHSRDGGWIRKGSPQRVVNDCKPPEEPALIFTKNGYEQLADLDEENVEIE